MNIGVPGKKIALTKTANKHVVGPDESVSGKQAASCTITLNLLRGCTISQDLQFEVYRSRLRPALLWSDKNPMLAPVSK